MSQTINIAEDFTRYPGGRYPSDGAGNGTDFRGRFLLPVLRRGDRAKVVLDGAAGYPSSFLDEAFAGLVRHEGYSADQVLGAFDLTTSDPAFLRVVEMVKRYVREAKRERA